MNFRRNRLISASRGRVPTHLAATVCALVISACASASPRGVSGITSVRQEIQTMMERSAAAWSRGDLDGFMDAYEDGDSTTFIGRDRVLRGRSAIRDAYAPRFRPGASHDSLSFTNLEVDLLAPDVANVIATWQLWRGDSLVAHGPTSLVMRKRGAWRILHDHSS